MNIAPVVMFTSLELFLLVLLPFVASQDVCSTQVKCGACIQEPACAWCADQSLPGQNHCFPRDSKQLVKCENKIDPTPSETVRQNIRIQSKPGKQPVQVAPQLVELKLRRGQEYKLKFQYAQASNFPIDLYYMMDLSNSMKPHQENLGKLGTELVKVMRKITSDFKVGFGSFVDKVVMPFTSAEPSRLKHPCPGCAAPYSFKHHLNLTSDDDFAKKVREAPRSGNLDTPEGGLDGLMQVMVCEKEIGWRKTAQRLIVFSTDAPFHIAGDGKLGGVVKPNPGKCLLENNKYLKADLYDYPSISHINYIARENGYNIFFAVTNYVMELYENLQTVIDNSVVGELHHNTNIPKLISDFYKKISGTIKMTDNSTKHVQISYTSDCKSGQGNTCEDIHAEEVINFVATIKPLTCLKGVQTIQIKPGTLAENLLVHLEVICDCDCENEKHGSFVTNSTSCNKHGDTACGICSCKGGYYGNECECSGSSINVESNTTACIAENSNKVCSGLGDCFCETCVCNKRSDPKQKIYGKFCECDNYSCPKKVELCSGHGRCDCGKCECDADWTGTACECSNNNDTCTFKDRVCNGKGTCECGRCHYCEPGYFGKFCEECTTCKGTRCDELKSCVECKVHNTGKLKDDCDSECSKYSIKTLDKIDEDIDNVKVCQLPSKDECIVIYSYAYNEQRSNEIEAEKILLCPTPVYYWILGIIGTILLAGILLLIIWKVFTHFHDKIEYNKFEQERHEAQWNQNDNPLFKPAVSEFKNPAFGGFSFKKSTSSGKQTN